MKPKQKIITQTGIVISGEVQINLWDGGQGAIPMDSTFLPNDKITSKNILRCINDGGFGCESIESGDIVIEIMYDNYSREYNRAIFTDHPIHTKYFLGWNELRKQEIEI